MTGKGGKLTPPAARCTGGLPPPCLLGTLHGGGGAAATAGWKVGEAVNGGGRGGDGEGLQARASNVLDVPITLPADRGCCCRPPRRC